MYTFGKLREKEFCSLRPISMSKHESEPNCSISDVEALFLCGLLSSLFFFLHILLNQKLKTCRRYTFYTQQV